LAKLSSVDDFGLLTQIASGILVGVGRFRSMVMALGGMKRYFVIHCHGYAGAGHHDRASD
jgi:hypothetical protein